MLRYILALCYRAAYLLHHALRLRPGASLQHSQLIVVGSFRTGGAGKTPFCIWLCKHYAQQGKRVALLAHEYAFDEITMLRQKFSDNGNVEIFATNNRYRLAHERSILSSATTVSKTAVLQEQSPYSCNGKPYPPRFRNSGPAVTCEASLKIT